ncbi:hypothetical protein VDIAB_80040 [Vibrio diabolicus]|jgi:hypothetical protein|nr:hypothetical protein VDIAB_80040 [Vibrio diabolicus]
MILKNNPNIAAQKRDVFAWNARDIVTIKMDFSIGWALYRADQFQQGTFTSPGMPA